MFVLFILFLLVYDVLTEHNDKWKMFNNKHYSEMVLLNGQFNRNYARGSKTVCYEIPE